MRKKRLAFAKFGLIMACLTLLLMDKPTSNCVFPMILGVLWNLGKISTQMGFKMTPFKFYAPRSFL